MVVEDVPGRIEEFENRRVVYRIVNVRANLSGNDDVLVSKYGKLLGCVGLLHFELLADFSDCSLAVTQAVENGNAKRVGESLEELRLELTQLRHEVLFQHSHPDVCIYVHIS